MIWLCVGEQQGKEVVAGQFEIAWRALLLIRGIKVVKEASACLMCTGVGRCISGVDTPMGHCQCEVKWSSQQSARTFAHSPVQSRAPDHACVPVHPCQHAVKHPV